MYFDDYAAMLAETVEKIDRAEVERLYALMDEARARVQQALERCEDEGVKEWAAIKANVRDALGRYLFDKTRRRPMILPIIMEL